MQECAAQGLELVRLDDALTGADPVPVAEVGGRGRLVSHEQWAPSSWGRDGNLSTWSAPAVADMAFGARAAELRLLASGPRAGTAAVRELLAMQSSDWAFLVSEELAPPYGRERFDLHADALSRALLFGSGEGPRNIAIDAHLATLFSPA